MNDTYFTKRKIIIFVYNSYIDGLSSEEISLKVRICKKIEIPLEEVNSIIDDVNLIFV